MVVLKEQKKRDNEKMGESELKRYRRRFEKFLSACYKLYKISL